MRRFAPPSPKAEIRFPCRSARPRRFGCALQRVAGWALAAGLAAASAHAQSAVIDHVATPETFFDTDRRTYISHPLIDARPEAVFFVTHHWNPPGWPSQYNDHSTALIYVGLAGQRWAVTNRDGAAIPEESAFTLWIPRPGGSAGGVSFRHTTAAANVFANRTRLDHPALNGQPDRLIAITPVFESAEPDAEFGAWYEAGVGRWTIFRQDPLATMPTGLSFNVCVGNCGISAGAVDVDASCPPNPSGSNVCAVFSGSALTRQHRLLLSGGWDGVYLDDSVGLYWSSSPAGWGIFLEDTLAAMPEGARFTLKSTGLLYENGFESGDLFGWTVP
jgi:hypothetical protein